MLELSVHKGLVPLTGMGNNITYPHTKMALQPGKTYEWLVFTGKPPDKFVVFQVMDAQQRDRITAELRKLENEQKAEGRNKEAIALAKANYLARA